VGGEANSTDSNLTLSALPETVSSAASTYGDAIKNLLTENFEKNTKLEKSEEERKNPEVSIQGISQEGLLTLMFTEEMNSLEGMSFAANETGLDWVNNGTIEVDGVDLPVL